MNNHDSQDVYQIAHRLASHMHMGQLYGPHPYIYHLEAVVASVKLKWGEHNRALLAVAILHDIIEDTSMTEQRLAEHVGKDVAKYVAALSKIEGEAYEDYIARVRKHHYSKEVKIHDTLCNLTESIIADSTHRVKKYSKQLALLVAD